MAIGPFVAYVLYVYFSAMDFFKTIQLLCYVGALLLILFRNESRPLIFPKYLLFYFLFICYDFYSTIGILDREFKVIWLFSNRAIGGFLIMFIIENIYVPKNYYRSILKVSKVILVIAIFVILMQQVVNPNLFIRTDLINEAHLNTGDEDRLLSIYSWLDLLAIGFSFIPIFVLIVEDLSKHNRKVTIWVISGLIFALLAKSRWIMLNSLLVMVVLYINQRHKTILFLKMTVLVPLIAVVFILALKPVGINVEGIIKDRVFENRRGGILQGSASTRILAFKAFNEFYWDEPIWGKGNIKYGMGGTGKQDYKLRRFLAGHSSQIHVGYLSLFYMYGIVGGITFLLFLYFLLLKLYKNAKKTKIWAPFLGLTGFAIANLTLVWFSVFEMGFIIVLVADRYYMQNLKESNK